MAEDFEIKLQESISKILELSDHVITEKVKAEIAKQAADVAEKKEEQLKGRPLSGYLDFISGYSTQASSINRSLALAGIAVIWIFKKPVENQQITPNILNFPLLCLVISLGLDLLQYFFAAAAWRIFYEHKFNLWKKKNFDPSFAKDIEAPNAISLPVDIIFVVKIGFMILAYIKIFGFLWTKI